MTCSPPPPDAGPSRYAKMNGIGNAILVLDRRGLPPIDGETAARLGKRQGLAFDQLMALSSPHAPDADAFVDIFNIDGSRAGACGNGTRCVAWYLLEGSDRTEAVVETAGARLHCRRDAPWRFTVDMGLPRLGWRDIPLRDAVADTTAFTLEPHSDWIAALGPASAVSMGNPHVVFWLAADAPSVPLERIGPALEHHPMFPDRANVSFARIEGPARVRLDVWERGAGRTRACGSAACATLVSGVRLGRLPGPTAAIALPGGVLDITWRAQDGHVLMSGAVALETAGLLDVEPAGPVA